MAEYERGLFDDLAKTEQKAAGLVQDVIKAEQRTSLQKLTAPVEGMVQQLAIHTIGGVVTPAQALMVIVPAETRLEIDRGGYEGTDSALRPSWRRQQPVPRSVAYPSEALSIRECRVSWYFMCVPHRGYEAGSHPQSPIAPRVNWMSHADRCSPYNPRISLPAGWSVRSA